MDSSREFLDMTPGGFPHSDIPGSKLVCSSPRLIAAYHVLHRLLTPRHPPCALSSLIISVLDRTSAPTDELRRAAIETETRCTPDSSALIVKERYRSRGQHLRLERRRRRARDASVRAGGCCLRTFMSYLRVAGLHASVRSGSAPRLVELTGIEPATSALQGRRSPS